VKKIGIIGSRGYTGGELIRLLARRTDVELVCLNSEGAKGRPVREVVPECKIDLNFTDCTLEEINGLGPDLVFLCMPDGFARDASGKLNCRVLDLSRDLRFQEDAVYGLPEIFRSRIAGARVAANPGCYATACILAAYPMVKLGLVERIVFDCKSGFSGAGRTPSYRNDPKHYTDNILAYRLTDHDHRREIARCLDLSMVSFTPHVLPVFRGLLATVHIILKDKISGGQIRDLYREAYRDEPFVRVLDRIPELHDVQNNNLCCLGGFETDDADRLVVVSALDNLMKGASGQAVQNMNLMLGLTETEGLPAD
jgi:N-acetyl-gamma-glutamyl-phosphate reductase